MMKKGGGWPWLLMAYILSAICPVEATRSSPAAAQAYVANSKSGTVSVINTTTNTVSGSPITVGGEPYRVAVTPDGHFVYVTNAMTNSVSVIDTQVTPPTVVKTISLNGSGRGVAITADGRFAYVVGGQTLHKIDIVNNHTLLPGVFIQGSTSFGPDGVAVTPDGVYAYVADKNMNGNSLFIIDAVSMTMVRPSPDGLQPPVVGGSIPRDVVVRPDGAYVYNSAFQDGAIEALRVFDSEWVGGCFPTGTGPIGITAWGSAGQGNGQFIATANSNGNSVSICPVSDLGGFGTAPPAAVPVGGGLKAGPQYLAVSPNGQFLYVTLKLQNSVEVLSLASTPPVKVTTIPVGSAPLGVAVAPLATGPPPPPPGSPALSVIPGSLSFTGELGLADPVAQSIQVANTGGGALNWSVLDGSGGASWLTLNPQAGVAPPAASITAGVKTCGLPVGNYTGSVTVSASGAAGSPLTIPVSLAVTPPTAPLPLLPTAKVCTDRTTYRTGDILHVSLSLRQGVSSNSGDAYLFAPIPGSTSFVSLALIGGVIVPVIGNQPLPFGTGFQVPDFAGMVFERAFDGTEPAGVYEIEAVLALPGSDPTVPANQLAMGFGSFTFAP